MSLLGSLSSFTLEAFSNDTNKKYENAMFANGLWQKRREPVGEFIVQMEKLDGRKYGLTKDCQFSFSPSLPKMPHTIFDTIVKYYRDIYAIHKSEVYASVFWDITKKDYFIHVPKQTVSGAAVTFENDPEMMNNPNYIIVMDTHSHNIMGAFWSQTDKNDQKASRLFGVIGKILDEKPATLFTAGSNQQEVVLKLDDVFDFENAKLHEDSVYEMPANAFSNVSTRPIVTPPARTTTGGKPYNYATGGNSHLYDDDYYAGGGYYGGYGNYGNYNSGKSTKTNSVIAARTALISAINAFDATYYVNESKLIDIVDAFGNFLELSNAEKSVLSTYDVAKLEDAGVVAQQSFGLTIDNIVGDIVSVLSGDDDTVVTTTGEVHPPALIGAETEQVVQTINFKDVDIETLTFEERSAFDDGKDSYLLGLQLEAAKGWYTLGGKLTSLFEAGYHAAESEHLPQS